MISYDLEQQGFLVYSATEKNAVLNEFVQLKNVCLCSKNVSHLYIRQMPYFLTKMHQIQFRLEPRPRPRWWSLQRSPDPLAGGNGVAAPSPRTPPPL